MIKMSSSEAIMTTTFFHPPHEASWHGVNRALPSDLGEQGGVSSNNLCQDDNPEGFDHHGCGVVFGARAPRGGGRAL